MFGAVDLGTGDFFMESVDHCNKFIHSLRLKLAPLMYSWLLSWLGFLPRETAEHHRSCVLSLVTQALSDAQLKPSDLDVICFTKGRCMSAFAVLRTGTDLDAEFFLVLHLLDKFHYLGEVLLLAWMWPWW